MTMSVSHRVLPILVLAICWVLPVSAQSAPATQPSLKVALTFDDLPTAGSDADQLALVRRFNARMLRVLQRHHAPAVGFVNEFRVRVPGQTRARANVLAMWLKAGYPLGNHTFSHANLQEMPLPAYEKEVLTGETITRPLMQKHGMQLRYFRYPFTTTGPTAEIKREFQDFLRNHGYVIAPFTMENADFIYNKVFRDAEMKHDDVLAAKIRSTYLEQTKIKLDYFEQQSENLFGRNIAQIMLMHVNRLNADALDDVLQLFEQRGYSFITLDEALKDPAYRTPDNYVGTRGFSWIYRWEPALGKQFTYQSEPDPPAWVLDLYKEKPAAISAAGAKSN